MKKIIIIVFAFAVVEKISLAESLKSAVVMQVYNDVRLTGDTNQERPATVQDKIEGRDMIRTGKKSRAELEFADKSIARLGSNTLFSFDPASRDMNIQRGSVLVHVPPGKSGARIATPAATAAITGDVVAMRVNGQGDTQVLALSRDAQGPIRVTLNKTGETQILQPGQLLTIRPTDIRIAPPVSVSVEAFLRTSSLTTQETRTDRGFSSKLPESAKMEIQQAQAIQQKEIQKGGYEQKAVLLNKMGASEGGGMQPMAMGVLPGTIMIQSSVGNRMAGKYFGMWADQFVGGENGKFFFNVRSDGSIVGRVNNAVTGKEFAVTGRMGPDGAFNLMSDEGNNKGAFGKINLAEASFSGNVNHDHNGNPVSAVLTGRKE